MSLERRHKKICLALRAYFGRADIRDGLHYRLAWTHGITDLETHSLRLCMHASLVPDFLKGIYACPYPLRGFYYFCRDIGCCLESGPSGPDKRPRAIYCFFYETRAFEKFFSLFRILVRHRLGCCYQLRRYFCVRIPCIGILYVL